VKKSKVEVDQGKLAQALALLSLEIRNQAKEDNFGSLKSMFFLFYAFIHRVGQELGLSGERLSELYDQALRESRGGDSFPNNRFNFN
jgi:hypothetical protein